VTASKWLAWFTERVIWTRFCKLRWPSTNQAHDPGTRRPRWIHPLERSISHGKPVETRTVRTMYLDNNATPAPAALRCESREG